MRPIDGIVIDSERVQLRGGTVKPYPHGLPIGTNVKVHFDFTEMKIRAVEEARHVFPGMSLAEWEPDEDESDDEGCVRLDHDIVDEIFRFDCASEPQGD
jgi:hypothetical protein